MLEDVFKIKYSSSYYVQFNLHSLLNVHIESNLFGTTFNTRPHFEVIWKWQAFMSGYSYHTYFQLNWIKCSTWFHWCLKLLIPYVLTFRIKLCLWYLSPNNKVSPHMIKNSIISSPFPYVCHCIHNVHSLAERPSTSSYKVITIFYPDVPTYSV